MPSLWPGTLKFDVPSQSCCIMLVVRSSVHLIQSAEGPIMRTRGYRRTMPKILIIMASLLYPRLKLGQLAKRETGRPTRIRDSFTYMRGNSVTFLFISSDIICEVFLRPNSLATHTNTVNLVRVMLGMRSSPLRLVAVYRQMDRRGIALSLPNDDDDDVKTQKSSSELVNPK